MAECTHASISTMLNAWNLTNFFFHLSFFKWPYSVLDVGIQMRWGRCTGVRNNHYLLVVILRSSILNNLISECIFFLWYTLYSLQNICIPYRNIIYSNSHPFILYMSMITTIPIKWTIIMHICTCTHKNKNKSIPIHTTVSITIIQFQFRCYHGYDKRYKWHYLSS